VVEDLLEQRRLRRVYEPLDAAGLVGDLLPAAGVEDQLVVDPHVAARAVGTPTLAGSSRGTDLQSSDAARSNRARHLASL